ncbi:hypothetical protein R4Y45_07020 [Holzapfeliella sp. He02]|uniref:Uncharacterized protein n=1 Tax=Holzapfeliella saturejae TaxID=3082953 RepID=A0ABU8SI10_9LACO
MVGMQRLFFRHFFTLKNLSMIFLIFLAIVASVDFKYQSDLSATYQILMQGLSFEALKFDDIIRVLMSYLGFCYLFTKIISFNRTAYVFLVLSRLKNYFGYFNARLVFALILSVIYWLLYLIVIGSYLVIFHNNELIELQSILFSTLTLYFYLMSILSCLTLALMYIIIQIILKDDGAALTFLIIYIVINLTVGNQTILWINTGLIQLARTTVISDNQINLNISIGYLVSQNIIVYSVISLILTRGTKRWKK